jgi:hypothetical protein
MKSNDFIPTMLLASGDGYLYIVHIIGHHHSWRVGVLK